LVWLGVISGCAGNVSNAATSTEADTRPDAVGVIEVERCRGLTGVDERCLLVVDGSACAMAPCARLVVVFSGGDMGCVDGAGYRKVLETYAANGYAAVCINYFETSTGAGAAPFVDEAERIDHAVRAATTGDWARTYWSGEELLLEGISHGATAPLILMMRTTLDDQPHWHGRRRTAGCFFDGSYDQVATAELLKTGGVGGGECVWPVPYRRWLERYCGAGATPESCDLSAQDKVRDDTIVAADPATLAISDLRLFECGSDLRACTGDIIPAAPIASLCSRVDADPARACTFTALPADSHLTCHADHFDTCRPWFETVAVDTDG